MTISRKKKSRQKFPIKGEYRFARTARSIIGRQVRAITENRGGTLAGDPDALHDMRVAVRRLRTALKLFRKALPRAAARSAREDLKWLSGCLAPTRDLDVQTELVAAHFGSGLSRKNSVPGRYYKWLLSKRSRSQRSMKKIVTSQKFSRIIRRLQERLAGNNVLKGNSALGRLSTFEAGPRLILSGLRDLQNSSRELDRLSTAAELHSFRKECRRQRYLCEFLGEIYGKPLKKTRNRLVALQDSLGSLQDAIVGQKLVSSFARYLVRTGISGRRSAPLTRWYIEMAEEARYSFSEAMKHLAISRECKRLEQVLGNVP